MLIFISAAAQAQQLKLGKNPTVLKKSALLELESDNQGLLLTRVNDTTALSPLFTADDGTLIYLKSDNSLYIRSLAGWRKLSTGSGTGTITLSGDLTGTGTGTVPATISNQAVSFAKFQNINTQRLLGRYTAGAGSMQEISLNSSLKLNTGGTLYADSALAIWNASKIQSRRVLDTVPGNGDVLKWNPTRAMWLPSQDITGGASYGTLTDNDISKATAPDPQYRMKIWASPISGVVQNGPLGTGAHAWSVLSFQMQASPTNAFTTQLYFDKNTLALKEWGGVDPLTTNTGNTWYKVVTTHGDNSFTDGGIIFAGKTSDANTEVRQDAANFFWNNSSKSLAIGSNAPTSTLDLNGSFSLPIRSVNGSTTVTATDYTIIKTGNGNATITLPAASSCPGRVYVVKRISGSGTVGITSNGGNVDGSGTLNMGGTANLSFMLQSDGNNWYTLSKS
ncbi:hypothetical protein [uncultured Chitinophaga sp.]|uniref:hypothetical protein n=1 Tax=uncultured Chitinophaga sp. TaxID=339340 RepID=UPI00260BF7AE|nr:hypothetical protein [uncultured Chitinophaga sp.]